MTNPYDYFRHNPSRFPVLMPDNPGTVGASPGTVGANPASVAGVPVPAECWNSNEFASEYSQNIEDAASVANWFATGTLPEDFAWVNDLCGGMSEAQCATAMLAEYTRWDIEEYCSGTGIRSCDTASVVMEVQTALKALGYNIAVDGAWGKQSQDALNASGKTFQQLATSQCEPPVPHYTAGAGGGGTQVTPPPPGPGTGVTPVGNKDKKDEGMSPWWWLVIGGAAAVGVGLIVNANKAKDNPVLDTSPGALLTDNSQSAQTFLQKLAKARFGRHASLVWGKPRTSDANQWIVHVYDPKHDKHRVYQLVHPSALRGSSRAGYGGSGIHFARFDEY